MPAGSTGGELLEMELTDPPHSAPPAPHYHPFQEEHFEIVRGQMRVQVGDVERTYEAGEAFVVPPGISHWMYNPGDERAQVIWQVRPALRTETMFETTWGLAADGKTSASGTPGLLQAAVIGQAYNREFRLTKPPYGLMRIVFALLAPLGRLRRYRAVYPKYSGQRSAVSHQQKQPAAHQ